MSLSLFGAKHLVKLNLKQITRYAKIARTQTRTALAKNWLTILNLNFYFAIHI